MKWFFILFVVSLPFQVQAKVTAAMVFPSHAQVVWKKEIVIAQGQGEITLPGFPLSMEEDTLITEIVGLPGVLTRQLQVRQVEQTEVVAQATRSLQEELRQVEHRIGTREDKIEAWNQTLRLMSQVSGSPREIGSSELIDLGNTVREKTQDALDQIRSIRQGMAADIAERDRIQRELAGTQQDARATKTITIAYHAERPGKATVRLQYQTRDAGWRSQYNARLMTGDGKNNARLVLEQLALIRQDTGSDWDEVRLSLSTANTRSGTDIPPLRPWVVSTGAEYRSSKAGVSADVLHLEALSAPGTTNVQNDGAFSQSYLVDEPVFLASGTADQLIVVASHELPVSVETRLFPAMDLSGFIHATGRYEAEMPLPGGNVTLYRDGQSVGRTYLPMVPNGSEIAMGFGVNNRITAVLANEQDQTGEQGVFKGEKFVRRVNRYEITNGQPDTAAVRVFDRIPVSRQAEVKIEELEVTTPVQRNPGDVKGILSWERSIEPGETLTLKSGFELRVPEDSSLPPEFQNGAPAFSR